MLNILVTIVVASLFAVTIFYILLFNGILQDFQFKKQKLYNFSLVGSFAIFIALQIWAISIWYNNLIVDIPLFVYISPLILSIIIPIVILLVVIMRGIRMQKSDMVI